MAKSSHRKRCFVGNLVALKHSEDLKRFYSRVGLTNFCVD